MYEQKGRRIGAAGSFQNQIMSWNATQPKVGGYASLLHYTDRDAYAVVEVTENKVKLEYLNAVAAKPNSPMGHQDWEFEKTGQFKEIEYCPKRQQWGRYYTEVVYEPKFLAELETRRLTTEEREKLYGDDIRLKLVPGLTKLSRKKWSPFPVIFTERPEYYYDWSF